MRISSLPSCRQFDHGILGRLHIIVDGETPDTTGSRDNDPSESGGNSVPYGSAQLLSESCADRTLPPHFISIGAG